MKERRKLRSNNKRLAAHFYILNLTARDGVQAVVLGNRSGDFVAGVESERLGGDLVAVGVNESYGRKLAVVAPRAYEDAKRGDTDSWKGRNDLPLTASPVDLEGEDYFLTVVGNRDVAKELTEDAGPGLKRIFSSAA